MIKNSGKKKNKAREKGHILIPKSFPEEVNCG